MFRNLPKVTKNLLIINTIIWFAAFLMNRMGNDTLMNLFALHFPSGSEDSRFRIWQLLSYMFLHDDTRIWHLLFNMYTLAIFGQVLERVWGGGKFLFFYLFCGVGAGLCQIGAQYIQFSYLLSRFEPDSVRAAFDMYTTVGASGGIYGVLLGYGMLFPDPRLTLIFPPVSMKAKWFVIIFAAIELLSSLGTAVGRGDGVAHIAHLGGMLFALVLILFWKKRRKMYEYHD